MEMFSLFHDNSFQKEHDFELFKNREIKAKSIFSIKEVDKNSAYEFVKKYHYLGNAKFFSQQAFGLFYHDSMVGVATFSQPQGTATAKGWFGLTTSDKSIYELSRLCLLPTLNGTNATSFLLGGAIKALKRQGVIKAIITLADSSRHVGSIYQVCNFKYYGLTNTKSDFFCIDGTVNPRGATKCKRGVWLPRTRKHRYCYLIDKTLNVLYQEKEKPSTTETTKTECCGGTGFVYDKRFGDWFTCPKCSSKFRIVNKEELA